MHITNVHQSAYRFSGCFAHGFGDHVKGRRKAVLSLIVSSTILAQAVVHIIPFLFTCFLGPVVSFKAGKCKFENQTVTAEPRKGEVVVSKGDDGLHRFVWRTRSTPPQNVDDVMLVGQITWEKVPECKDGRVYALRCVSGDSHCL